MRLGRPAGAAAAFTLTGVPEGVEGVRVTLEHMRRIVRAFRVTPLIYNLSRQLIAHVPSKDFAGEARALFNYVRSSIRYVNDPNEVETLQTPEVTLNTASGDCDDFSTLLASLLESIGHPTRFVAVGFEPNSFEHVYVETRLGNSWIAADPTESQEFGWAPPDTVTRMVRHI